MRRWRWRRPEPALHGSGPRRPRRPRWLGRLPGRAAGALQRQAPQPGGNALVRPLILHLSRCLTLRVILCILSVTDTVAGPPCDGLGTGRPIGVGARCGTDVGAAWEGLDS